METVFTQIRLKAFKLHAIEPVSKYWWTTRINALFQVEIMSKKNKTHFILKNVYIVLFIIIARYWTELPISFVRDIF